jgi:hypothetical protein
MFADVAARPGSCLIGVLRADAVDVTVLNDVPAQLAAAS